MQRSMSRAGGLSRNSDSMADRRGTGEATLPLRRRNKRLPYCPLTVHDNDELRRYRALRALRAAERRWGDAKVLSTRISVVSRGGGSKGGGGGSAVDASGYMDREERESEYDGHNITLMQKRIWSTRK